MLAPQAWKKGNLDPSGWEATVWRLGAKQRQQSIAGQGLIGLPSTGIERQNSSPVICALPERK